MPLGIAPGVDSGVRVINHVSTAGYSVCDNGRSKLPRANLLQRRTLTVGAALNNVLAGLVNPMICVNLLLTTVNQDRLKQAYVAFTLASSVVK